MVNRQRSEFVYVRPYFQSRPNAFFSLYEAAEWNRMAFSSELLGLLGPFSIDRVLPRVICFSSGRQFMLSWLKREMKQHGGEKEILFSQKRKDSRP